MTQPAETQETVLAQFDALYEFEREPVSETNLQSGPHFAGLFAGEHVAGTEFVIGALFVNWGASTRDILLGLLLGNFFAVLSWALICAPIAVQTRLTLYWYLRRIAGPVVTGLYNVVNAVLFCILAGAMITVSASAVRLPFHIPAQTKWYPEDWRFVALVLLLGAIVVFVAIRGFDLLARFASICSPWIFAMFFAGAVSMLPLLGEFHSAADLWRLADQFVWTGRPPTPGAEPIGFWHIVAFAWICNLAMHVGLSDMALLRYAPKSSYGLFSACGMYLGHYLAWICAGVMGAAVAHTLQQPLTSLDAGDVAYTSLGISGALAVILAGWTTSNPTLYRAGLAFQAVTPGWPRWFVTLLAGIATTVMACFPFVFLGLLDFVAWYGILLMPVGAIVFVEHWCFPRWGWPQFMAGRTGKAVHGPALAAWGIAIAAALLLWKFGVLHMFFLAIPIWLLTAAVYLVLTKRELAKLARRGTPIPVLPAMNVSRLATQATAERTPVPKSPASSSLPPVARKIAGWLAVATFCCLIALPLWVCAGEPSWVPARRALFLKWLPFVTLLHLASAWFSLRTKR